MLKYNIYWEIVHCKSDPQIHGDLNLYPFLETVDWKPIFTLVFNLTIETYLQTFQLKILHRSLNCRYNIFNWKNAEHQYVLTVKLKLLIKFTVMNPESLGVK